MNLVVTDQSLVKKHDKKLYISLMDMYEQNYIKLRCLIPDMNIADIMVSQVKGYNDLHLAVKERCKFTTILNLSYHFQKQGYVIYQPDMTIRIYHDAKTAEVQNQNNRHHQIHSKSGSLEHQWRINRFLFKWLSYSLRQGHRFYCSQK